MTNNLKGVYLIIVSCLYVHIKIETDKTSLLVSSYNIVGRYKKNHTLKVIVLFSFLKRAKNYWF